MRDQRLALVDHTDFGGGPAHVKGDQAAMAGGEAIGIGRQRPRGWPRFEQAYRVLDRRLHRGNAAAGEH